MPAKLKEVLYTAEAIVEGGREGHGRTSDGRLEVDLSIPASMSGDTGLERTRSNCSPSGSQRASSRRYSESPEGGTSTRPDRTSPHKSASARSTRVASDFKSRSTSTHQTWPPRRRAN